MKKIQIKKIRIIPERRKDSLDFNRRRKKFDFLKLRHRLIFLLEILLVILLSYFLARSFGIRVQNVGPSMESTISDGNYLLTDKIIYKIKKPSYNDIIVFKPKNSNTNISIKRVIALPNDTVQIKGGIIYVNNKMRQELLKVDEIRDPGLAEEKVKLKKDEYFVLGDNRNNSEDSRLFSIGNIKKSDIIGKVWFNLNFKHIGIL